MTFPVRIWFRFGKYSDETDCENFDITADTKEEAEFYAKRKRKYVFKVEFL